MSDAHEPSGAPIDPGFGLPAARTSGGLARVIVLAGASALAVAAVLFARQYSRPEPEPDKPAPGMTVGSDSITLAPGAPQWNIIKTSDDPNVAAFIPPRPTDTHWTKPLPARVTFDETRTSRLGAPLAGRVSSVLVERGQRVTAGQPLFTIASPSLADMRADRDKAMVELTTAKAAYDRTAALVEAQSLPAKELVTAKQTVEEAELALKLANQKLQSLRVGEHGDSTFTVTAPREGVVVEKTVNAGQQVSPDSGSLMAIADLSNVWVLADMFEANVGGITAGAKARVDVGEAADTQFEATVEQVSSVVDPERHTVPIRLKLPNPNGLLRPNAYVQVQLLDPNATDLMLPAQAVMSDGTHSYVFVKQAGGVLKRREVEVGSVSAGWVPVRKGLDPKEPVVVQGIILLDNEIALQN
jgi:RND family efflux transporter MFP subunit